MHKNGEFRRKVSTIKNRTNVLCQVGKCGTPVKGQSESPSPSSLQWPSSKSPGMKKYCLELRDSSNLQVKARKLLGLGENSFVQGLDDLSKFLAELEPAPSALFRAIDQKGQDFSTYFFAAYSETRDVTVSYRIYKTIKSLVRYIVLMDRYYEIGNLKYKRMAAELLRSVKADSEGYLKYAINFSFAQCWPFWESEKLMKERMIKGCNFSYKEIRYHNMFKSSDAPTIYGRVLDSELENYNPNVSLILHYNQALQDIQDDLDDLEEDLYDKMPNIFILSTTEYIPFSTLATNPDCIRDIVANCGSLDKICDLVHEYENSVEGIELPSQYRFLKYLTHAYAKKLYESIQLLKEDALLANKVPNPTIH
jgi:hypothetical protein